MKNTARFEAKSIKTTFNDIAVFTQSLKVKDVVYIHYVAVRRRDEEEGAVQRPLSRQRIKSIKDFILSGGLFLNTFILNWTELSSEPIFENGTLTIPYIPGAAQVIDGQHRLAGFQEAMKENSEIGEKELIVSISIRLTTKQAASIFLNINSEQRPVPKSLIYDLYGIVEDDREFPINRANDIASELNESKESPYYNAIKYPGAPRGAGFIDLSTVVSSLKKHFEHDGVFVNYGITDLDRQKQLILNFFNSIKFYYEKEGFWYSKTKNPFLQNAGFHGAVDCLTSTLLSKCVERKSFTVETFRGILSLEEIQMLLPSDIKNLGGTAARKKVREFLESGILQALPHQDEYEF